MFGITIQGPNQDQKFGDVKIPCTIGRHADEGNPTLSIDDPFVSRQHILLNESGPGQISIRCVGRSAVALSSGVKVERDSEVSVGLPIEISVGRSTVTIENLDASVSFLKATQLESSPPLMTQMIKLQEVQNVTTDQLIEWFESLIALQENAIGRQAFYQQAAQAVVDMIGLDRCVVLSRDQEKDSWVVETQHGEPKPNEVIFSRTVVDQVLDYQQTVFDESIDLTGVNSLASMSAFVGSPIFSSEGEVTGCLFGSRGIDHRSGTGGVKPLQAQLVQVVAGIIGSRLARLDAEAEQTRTQVQLEQFASPALVREMQDNPQWLEAQQRELTMLFGDIRGFSSLGEKLSAQELYSFVRDTMDCLTNVILDHGGFVFNYAGDGIAAMWNAPGLSSTHAVDACRAAIALQSSLPSVGEKWSQKIGGPVRVGVGIHTGTALVGNSGSKARLHYSPLGSAVNLASRLEGATKYFGVKTLISETTKNLIGDDFAARNLTEIVVVGIDQPVRVYELAQGKEKNDHWVDYNSMRELFEQGDREAAATKAQSILTTFGDDGPTSAMLKRINESSSDIGSTWKLGGK